MTFFSKIDEWIKEAEARPESALTILKLIARRLRELTERNEELLAENIALQNGTRVEEYQKRIAHLEYQLDLLKRRFGTGDEAALVELPTRPAEASTLSLLIYNAQGRIFRIEINPEIQELGRITGEMVTDQEPPRLLAIPSNEEALLLYTSGRVSTCTVSDIPAVEIGSTWAWEQAALPDEPHAGELLACIALFSHLPLSDFFLQVSRRGCVKKTMTSMAQSILYNHYLGRGTLQKSDRPFDLTLCKKQERLAFATYEGRLIGLDVDDLSYATEERIRISATDYVIASFTTPLDEGLLFMTQTGKVITRESGSLELSKSALAKGQALISPARLEQGIRFMGAASVRDGDQVAVLDAAGNLTVHLAGAMTGAGSIEAEGLILSIGMIPADGTKRAASMSVKVGIDFGTSNSGIAVYDGQRVRLLPIDPKNVLPEVIKSVLYITRDYRPSIGQEAVETYYRDNVNRQRRYVKQWVGEIDVRGADMHYVRDIYVYVDELKPGRLLQYLKTTLRKDDYKGTQIFERYYSVGDLAQTYLSLLKHRAEEVIGESIETVTLGRPVKFSESAEQDHKAQETLRQAAHEAGFKEVDFELEPIAAALDYEQSISKPQNVVIFDFGGGTLDIAVMRLGDPRNRKVYASGGVDIAGSDFDRAIIEKRMLPHFGYGRVKHQPEIMEMIHAIPDWMALPELGTPQNRNTLVKAVHANIVPVRMQALQRLIYNDLAFTFYNRVEAGKIALSGDGATIISLEDKDIALWELYTRHQFEADIQHYLMDIEKVLLDIVAKSGLEIEAIDAVVKNGGSSGIPLFTGMLTRIFGIAKVKESNTFSSVVAGLAIKAFNHTPLVE